MRWAFDVVYAPNATFFHHERYVFSMGTLQIFDKYRVVNPALGESVRSVNTSNFFRSHPAWRNVSLFGSSYALVRRQGFLAGFF